MMIVEDSGPLDIDLTTISFGAKWCGGGQRLKGGYKWRVDGRLGCEHYQEAVENEFIGWEKEVSDW